MFGGMFEFEGDPPNPEDFETSEEFVAFLMASISADSLVQNIQMTSLIWGAKTGKNPRYLFADQLAQTCDDEMWEKIQLPKVQARFPSFVSQDKVIPADGEMISEEDAADLRRLFGADETEPATKRFIAGADGTTIED